MVTNLFSRNEARNADVHISVVIPVYGRHLQLKKLYSRLKDSISNISEKFEIILVNDQSPDNAWDIITLLAKQDERVRGINLSRNFGQHHAITAGLNYARGSWVVVMDCDLQDQPEEIVKLYNKAIQGYDIVFGQRKKRKDKWIKCFTSNLFYKFLKFVSGINHDPSIASFGIYSNKIIFNILQYNEQTRSIGMFLHHIGFSKRTSIPIVHAERGQGDSAYTFRRKLKLAIDSIVSNSNKPLLICVKIGFVISLFSGFFGTWLILRYVLCGIAVPGWTSLMVSLYFLGGLILLNMGIIGVYLSKIYDEVKKRPLFHIQDKTF